MTASWGPAFDAEVAYRHEQVRAQFSRPRRRWFRRTAPVGTATATPTTRQATLPTTAPTTAPTSTPAAVPTPVPRRVPAGDDRRAVPATIPRRDDRAAATTRERAAGTRSGRAA